MAFDMITVSTTIKQRLRFRSAICGDGTTYHHAVPAAPYTSGPRSALSVYLVPFWGSALHIYRVYPQKGRTSRVQVVQGEPMMTGSDYRKPKHMHTRPKAVGRYCSRFPLHCWDTLQVLKGGVGSGYLGQSPHNPQNTYSLP